MDELELTASRGEMAQRLLENEDFLTCAKAFDGFLADQEQALAPMDKDRFTILRAIRRGVEQFGTFLEGVKSEGEIARKQMQTGDTGKIIRVS